LTLRPASVWLGRESRGAKLQVFCPTPTEPQRGGRPVALAALAIAGTAAAGTDPVANLHSQEPTRDERFGEALAVTPNHVFAGAPNATQNVGTNPGSVVVFDRATREQVTRIPSPEQADDNFGRTLAANSGRLVVGQPERDPGSNGTASIHVYAPNGTGWERQAHRSPAELAAFGANLAMDSDLAAVGAPDACTNATADGQGDKITTSNAEVCFAPWLEAPNPDAGAG